ncbi:hypothetical protein JW979_16340 [bacterium]|nr:hypothetical protein [candidate division CSSED10-310 bacterium]
MTKSKEMKRFTIRIKTGDILNLLNESKTDENRIRCLNIFFADYDPEAEIVIQLTGKTGEK